MNKFYTMILAAMMAMPTFAQWNTEEDCLKDQLKYGYPSYYCDCEFQIKKNKIGGLPFDITVTDTTWYKSSSGIMLDGCSAYLYSDCDVKMVVMQNCHNDESARFYKEVVVKSNQARDVEPSSIKELMEQNGVDGRMGIRIGIMPAEVGKVSRVICCPYNQGPNSTCEDCLPLLRNMVFVSSDMDNVYALAPSEIPAENGLKVEWFQTEYPAELIIRKGDCANGEVVASTMIMPDSPYELPNDLLNEMRGGEENLYLQFLSTGSAARIRLSEVQKTITGCDNITAPATNARLVLGSNGMIYILRDGVRYTLTGARF